MGWLLLIVLGVGSLLAGLAALLEPLAAPLGAVAIAGWSLLTLGVLQVGAAWLTAGWGARTWAILAGVAAALLGASQVVPPLAGTAAGLPTAGILFVASGMFKLFASFGVEGNLRLPVLLSAVASLMLGGIVLTELSGPAIATPGALLAVELVADGVALIAMGGFGRGLARGGAADGRMRP
jgi:membrane protein HdeD